MTPRGSRARFAAMKDTWPLLDKIPFPAPDHFLDMIECKYGRSVCFRDYMLPRAIIGFRQGVGRLIRDRADLGVVVCLDSRVAVRFDPHTKTRTYGSNYALDFQRAVPDMRRADTLAAAGYFLAQKGQV